MRRTGDVRDEAARPDRGQRAAQQPRLQIVQLLDRLGGPPPPRLGTPAEGPETGAGNVGQHPAERPVRPGRPGAVGHHDRRPAADRRGPRPRPAGPDAASGRRPAPDPACPAASPVSSAVLPPGPAQRSSHHPVGAVARASPQATSCDPSSWTPTSSRPDGRPGRPGSRSRWRRTGSSRPGPAPAAISSDTSARPGRTARVTAAGTLSASSAGSSSSAGRTSAKASTIHRGWAVVTTRRSARPGRR